MEFALLLFDFVKSSDWFCFLTTTSDLKQELKIQQKQPGSQRISSNNEDDNEKHDKDMDTEEGDQKANELAGEKADAKKMETDDSPQSNGVANGVLNCRQQKLNGHSAGTESGSVAPPLPPSSTANLQRESSLKRKLILAFSSTKSALRPACIFGPRTKTRKKSI